MGIILMANAVFAYPSEFTKEEEHTIQLMNQIEPFLSLNPDYTVTYNKQESEKLSPEAREFGLKYEIFHNQFVSYVKVNGLRREALNQELLPLFEPFFTAVRNTGSLSTSDLISRMGRSKTESPMTPKNLKSDKQKTIAFSSKNSLVNFQTVCGGGPTSPHYCPGWAYPSFSYALRSQMINFLLGQGYHKTNNVGCGYSTCPDDYTQPIYANNCNFGAFRSQGIVYASGLVWKYRYQKPEPNPEIFNYQWPAVWWGLYVANWHWFYCN